LSKAKQKAAGISCLSNTKQLALAWLMYADDHNGTLVANRDKGATAGGSNPDNWIYGVMGYGSGDVDSTNDQFLVNSLLGPYSNRSRGIYHCPADLSYVVISGISMQRVRSISMDSRLGNNNDIKKLNHVTDPNPAMKWVFVDEHPDSINDGYFVVQSGAGRSASWKDLVASYHNRAGGLSFADGHSEIHKWLEPSTLKPIERLDLNYDISAPGSRDVDWLQRRTFPNKQGQP
jgi:hypothetical protein